MKEFIKEALTEALEVLNRQRPKTKKETKTISIRDVEPLELTAFMKDNEVPDDAYFSGTDNGYDAWDDIVLAWEIDIPTTEKDDLKFNRHRFTTLAFKRVYDKMIANGYKRVGVNSGRFKEYDDTTIYDMFIKEDYDRLEKYYSMYFVKE